MSFLRPLLSLYFLADCFCFQCDVSCERVVLDCLLVVLLLFQGIAVMIMVDNKKRPVKFLLCCVPDSLSLKCPSSQMLFQSFGTPDVLVDNA